MTEWLPELDGFRLRDVVTTPGGGTPWRIERLYRTDGGSRARMSLLVDETTVTDVFLSALVHVTMPEPMMVSAETAREQVADALHRVRALAEQRGDLGADRVQMFLARDIAKMVAEVADELGVAL